MSLLNLIHPFGSYIFNISDYKTLERLSHFASQVSTFPAGFTAFVYWFYNFLFSSCFSLALYQPASHVCDVKSTTPTQTAWISLFHCVLRLSLTFRLINDFTAALWKCFTKLFNVSLSLISSFSFIVACPSHYLPIYISQTKWVNKWTWKLYLYKDCRLLISFLFLCSGIHWIFSDGPAPSRRTEDSSTKEVIHLQKRLCKQALWSF